MAVKWREISLSDCRSKIVLSRGKLSNRQIICKVSFGNDATAKRRLVETSDKEGLSQLIDKLANCWLLAKEGHVRLRAFVRRSSDKRDQRCARFATAPGYWIACPVSNVSHCDSFIRGQQAKSEVGREEPLHVGLWCEGTNRNKARSSNDEILIGGVKMVGIGGKWMGKKRPLPPTRSPMPAPQYCHYKRNRAQVLKCPTAGASVSILSDLSEVKNAASL